VLLQHLGQDSCECAQVFRHGYGVSSSPCVSSSSSPATRVFLSNAVKALALSLSLRQGRGFLERTSHYYTTLLLSWMKPSP
jgi:hypothetical protein